MASPAQRTRPRQQPEETRRQILESAEAFLRERPFRDLTIDAVMAGTGHTRTVFYRHFDDLPALALSVLVEIGAELGTISQRWAEAIEHPEHAVEDGLGAVVDFFAREGRLVRAIAEAAHYDEEIERVYGMAIDGFAALTAQAIERLHGLGRTVDPIDPPELARALTFMNERYLLESFGREPLADPERVLAVLVGIWRRSVYGGMKPRR
jgi:AcrR family transcriptional regulator